MASSQGSYGGYLEKIKAAKLDKKKKNSSQKVNKYNAAITRLELFLNGNTPRTEERRDKALKELKLLQEHLFQENGEDISIKDAKDAIKRIESKLEKYHTGERGMSPGALKGDRNVQGRSTASTPKQSVSSGSNNSAARTNGQADVSKTSTPKQVATSGPFDDENFVSFLKELKALISDEQKHFSEEVLRWCQNGKTTSAMQGLKAKIDDQRDRREELELKLNDCQDRLKEMTQTSNPGKSTGAHETSKSSNKKDIASPRSTSEEKENVKLFQIYKSEMSFLADDINNGSIDMTAFQKRFKKFQEDATLKELQQIRLQLAERFENSFSVKSEMEILAKEVEKGEYDNSSFANRMKRLKSVELEHISKMRDSLKKCETEINQMKMFIASLKEHRNDGKFTKIKVKGEKQWQEDMQSLINDLQKLVNGANGKYYDKIKQEVGKLQQYVESKAFDSAAEKWYTKLKEKDTVMRSLGCIAEQNAVWLSESSKTTKEITNRISTLKRKLIPGEKAVSDEEVDEQWKSDLEAIEKKATSMEKEPKDTTYTKIKAEIMQLKREMNPTSGTDSSETNDIEVLKALAEMQDQISKWKRQEKDLESLRAKLETGNLEVVKPTDKQKEEMTSPSVLQICSRIETIHKELDEITGQISALRHEIQKEEKSAKKNVVDRTWQDDINEIRKMVRDKDELLMGMQNSIQFADVLDELRVIEERLILTYKTDDMKMQHQNKEKVTKSRPPSNTKEIMRESLTVLVDRVDNMMNYFAQRTKRLLEENSELAQQSSNMKADILAIKNDSDKLKNDKAELILRLSNIAGTKLTENNANIADLSDPNRPTKLAEQYMEIYDNEWTNAYEALEKGSKMKEQQICLELLKILLNAESECREMAKNQYEQLCSCCTSPAGPGEKGELHSIHLKLINDLRKQTAKLSVSSVQKKILGKEKVSESSDIKKYQMKCVEICWYMRLQTPPVILDKPLKEGQTFDKDRYREFTKKGKHVAFVTWPTLLLHKDGPLLCKGVAQGK